MVFMGSKAKYADEIVPILQNIIDKNNIKLYIEPFVGGANVIDKIRCEERIGYDRSETLIALLKQARDDFSLLPTSGTREMWDEGKNYVKDGKPLITMSLADVGAIEYFASYCNGGFPRGYAKNTTTRNYYNEAYRNLEKQAPKLKDIEFKVLDYTNFAPNSITNALIYCDPPYNGTKQYQYSTVAKMDYNYFWNWIRELSKYNLVVVSEQNAPEDFECIWQKKATRTMNKENDFKAVEKLFVYKESPYFNCLIF